MRNKQENPNGLRRPLIARSLAACFLVISLLAAATCRAQINETGTITGTVTDKTGGAIPGASVTITNIGTNVSSQLNSNESGQFTQVGLNVGNYTVKVSAAGFSSYEKTNFYLAPTSVYTVLVALKPGATSETVQVTADAVVPERQVANT